MLRAWLIELTKVNKLAKEANKINPCSIGVSEVLNIQRIAKLYINETPTNKANNKSKI